MHAVKAGRPEHWQGKDMVKNVKNLCQGQRMAFWRDMSELVGIDDLVGETVPTKAPAPNMTFPPTRSRKRIFWLPLGIVVNQPTLPLPPPNSIVSILYLRSFIQSSCPVIVSSYSNGIISPI